MGKEILLYTGFSNSTAESFIDKMEMASAEDVTLRLNTDGGDVQSGFGMIAKFAEHKGKKTIKVDGKANSMGAFFLAFADNVEALDVSQIILHRAAYPSYIEAREGFKDSPQYDEVVKINDNLKAGLIAKIDIVEFEKITGATMDSMFSMESRIDISLTPIQAKKIGLVNKVNKLTSKMSAEINANNVSIAAEFGIDITEIKARKLAIEDKPKIINNMTIEDLQANHSEVFNKVFALGSKAGVAEETDRVNAWLVYNDVDAEAVSKGIKEGSELSLTIQAELSRKQFSSEILAKVEAEKAPVVTPEKVVTKEVKASTAKDELMALINGEKIK